MGHVKSRLVEKTAKVNIIKWLQEQLLLKKERGPENGRLPRKERV